MRYFSLYPPIPLPKYTSLGLLLFALLLGACDTTEVTPLTLVSVTANGISLQSETENIPYEGTVQMVFGSAVDPAAVREALSLTSEGQAVPLDLSFSGAATQVEVVAELAPATSYRLLLEAGPLGAQGQVLESDLDITFSTTTADTIRSQAPCTQTAACLQTATLQLAGAPRTFSFYANYPVYEDRARWEELTQAIVVVHGANRNASDYYSWLNTTLGQESLRENTLLLAPHFKQEQEASGEELYWSGNGWRDGQKATGTDLSSFGILDSLLARLADRTHFPALREVLITGHSSGGLYTHVYGVANAAEEAYPELAITYLPANSQYFYYPNGFRYDEGSGAYVQPTTCSTYDTWPMGYRFAPAYVQRLSQEALNAQYLDRKVIYLLGNGTGSDGSLNTSDCRATLLGTTRYQRGENVYAHTQAYFPDNAHEKRIVEGIGHDGQAMYQSSEFRAFLME